MATSPLNAQLDFARIDSLVEARREALGVPGMALVIVHPLAELHARGFGEAAAGVPVGPDTPFLIGSVSKPFTATVVMQLVDRGLVDLDAPVTRYLPSFTLADSSHASRITVRHLLAHRSGIPRDAGMQDFDTSTSLEEAVERLATIAPNAAPGQHFEYSNSNYHLLGLLAERVGGEPYPTLVHKQVFTPLGMHDAYTDLPAAQAAGLAAGHRFWSGLNLTATPHFNPSLLPAGNLAMSAHDLGTFVRAHLNLGSLGDTTLLSTASIIEMTTFDSGGRYALGWGWRTIEGRNAIGHSGALDTYQAEVVLLTSDAMGIILLSNTTGMLHLPAIRQVALDVARLAVGLEPKDTPRPGPVAILWMLGVGGLVIATLWVRDLMRLGSWRGALATERARGVRWPRRAILALLLDGAVLAAVPLAIQHFAGLSLPALLVIQADVGWFVIAGLAVSAIKLVVRGHALATI
jgi:CubicO group peptidase (beta-lactamase class C family)